MSYTVYIDGEAGTTGLQIEERLAKHPDVALLHIDPAHRKDAAARSELLNAADVAFLCLPDEAAIEAVGMVTNPRVRVIDASTAHRTAQGWAYGLPELSAQHRAAIAASKRIANPGCHATGFIAAVYPLVSLGIAAIDYPFTCHSVTGYSGGGKKMIAEYESEARPAALDSPRQYGLTQAHKHLSEMQKVCGLAYPPAFDPIVADFPCGMAVSVPLHARLLKKKLTRAQLQEELEAYYASARLLRVAGIPEGMAAANEKRNEAGLTLYVTGNDERMTLISVFDNLGKGASGAAVQNMNIALGLDECRALSEE